MGFCVFQEQARSYILMEYIPGKNLFYSKFETQEEFENIWEQLRSALCDIRSLGYAHGDISMANIMITNRRRIKIIDFGSVYKKGNACFYLMGTINPPESYRGEVRKLNQIHAIDLWCAAYCLLTVARGGLKRKLWPKKNSLLECLIDLQDLIQETRAGIQASLVRL
ncbi:hypothetical protein GMAR_ORF28 [Golden Marseillevirus]|uniref:hypothetical protein n=1 Tax=Golden Marseillevirus TaxID=1720526 RepID=UPI000877A9DA|nr:hypothetical protein GMAR_ORF28 [Golden Marseillevirus]ALX27403.1 hypothetical protein GMAR_ORF28 [Golden Marseillevirus]